MIIEDTLKLSVVTFGLLLIGYCASYSFMYWKDKTFGGDKMVLKNDVVDTGERVKKGLFQRKPIENKPPVEEQPQVIEQPEETAPQRQEMDIEKTINNIAGDMAAISDHMKILSDAMTYLKGYLKGKGMI